MMGICLMKRCCSRLLFLSLFCALMNQNEAISPDGEALMSFRSVVSSADGVVGRWRPEDPDPCNWKGVTCDAKTKRVIALMLHNNIYMAQYLQHWEIAHHWRKYTCTTISSLAQSQVKWEPGLSNNDLTELSLFSLGQLEKLTSFNVSNIFWWGKYLLMAYSRPIFEGRMKTLLLVLVLQEVNQLCFNQFVGQGGKTGKLLISASATVGGLLLWRSCVFWGCFLLYKSLSKSLAIEVGGGCGNVFALKRIVKLNGGFDRFFERELEILGSIKHRYPLVNLRGYCNSPHQSFCCMITFLVVALTKLFMREVSTGLGFTSEYYRRSSKGVAYLHHDCSPRIIPSSNILLDGNLEARVSDLGLPSGTFGYLAPEYMQSGRATEKRMFYSFGVLILEVLSGKLPTDTSYIEKGYNVVANFLISENRPRKIVDRSCEGVETESLDALLSIATKCGSSSPDERPTMHSSPVTRIPSNVSLS
ncbi:hypothetical protein HID58_095413 [Brassica napus]|uniref:Protein kinase domain-containing protein n=1 Tax=Brassica napus TaxID=3708 RepID=A0ABQ7X3N7_BRANA|nr:hypothetical protein HID58_095413 [Brassica napus]